MRTMILFAIATTLAGCASQSDQIRQGLYGQPQSYQDGFVDGCPSGEQAGGYWYSKFTKDQNRASTDSQYAQGWEDGFRVCKGRQESISRALR